MSYKDYYKILGVTKKSTQKEIKKAYRKLAAKYHPDKNQGDKKSEEKFKEINEANEVIGNVEKRKKYDTLGKDWQAYQQGGGDWNEYARNRKSNKNRSQSYHFEGDPSQFFQGANQKSDFSSFFDMFFGGDPTYRTNQERRTRDIKAELPISLQEAYSGAKKTFEIGGEKLRITIKPGAYHGQRLRLKGKGQKSSMESKRGDLFITLSIIDDSLYKRDGANLSRNIEIDLFTAVLGGKIKVSSLNGNFLLSIPSGTQNGKVFRLKGKGMPIQDKKDSFGNLLIKIIIKIPNKLSSEEKELFEKLQSISKKKKIEMN